jgi:hypothetical protein
MPLAEKASLRDDRKPTFEPPLRATVKTPLFFIASREQSTITEFSASETAALEGATISDALYVMLLARQGNSWSQGEKIDTAAPWKVGSVFPQQIAI